MNRDGSKTIYQYPVNIKFVDEDGKVQFKDTALVSSQKSNGLFRKFAYENAANDVKTYLPPKIEQGIRIEQDELVFTMKPVENGKVVQQTVPGKLSKSVDQMDSIQYEAVFDNSTTVEYIPTINGIKENIVLEEYTGRNEFQFDIHIGDLVPATLEGASIPLLDEDGKPRAVITQIDARDSYEGDAEYAYHKTLNNYQKLQKISGKGNYRLTIVVDQEFLKDESTAYPVIIDLNITFSNYNMYDTSVYSYYSNRSFHTESFNLVGYNLNSSVYGAMGEGRMYVNIDNMQNYKYINPDKISTVKFRVREGSGRTASDYINMNRGHSIWDQTTVRYSTGYGDYMGYLLLTAPGWYEFDIHQQFYYWLKHQLAEGGHDQRCGFVLRRDSTNTETNRHFHSAESSQPPSIKVNYWEDDTVREAAYFFQNKNSHKYLGVENGSLANDANVEQYAWKDTSHQGWYVQPLSGVNAGLYKITALHSDKSLDLYCGVNANNTNIQQYQYTGNDPQIWRIVKNGDGTYRVMPKLSQTRAIDVANASTLDGANVLLYNYRGTDNQKWTLERGYILHTYYDYGYETRYNAPSSHLMTKSNYIKDLYYAKFKIRLVFSTPSKYQSKLDICGGGDAVDSQCNHALDNNMCGENHPFGLHHKFQGNSCATKTGTATRAAGYIPITWTGHVVCKGGCTGNTHISRTIDGVTMIYPDNTYTISLFNMNEEATNSVFSLGHEIGHTLGAVGDTDHGRCIMSYNINSRFGIGRQIINKEYDVFCSTCENQIRSYLP